jgi:hypothetical protein
MSTISKHSHKFSLGVSAPIASFNPVLIHKATSTQVKLADTRLIFPRTWLWNSFSSIAFVLFEWYHYQA